MWDLLTWIDASPMAEEIRISLWLFPTLEIAHVAAIAVVLGSIARVDLRLAGLVSRDRAISDVSHEMLPWTWAGFVLATIFGVLLFVGQPMRYVEVAFFDAKIMLILLAGLNMLQGDRPLGPRGDATTPSAARRRSLLRVLDQRRHLRPVHRLRLN